MVGFVNPQMVVALSSFASEQNNGELDGGEKG
jgi:hypothetical protein